MAGRRPSFSEYYERRHYRLLFRWIDRRKVAVIRRALAELPSGALLVDVGCGSGEILARIARPGDLSIALDRDLSLLRRAERRGLTAIAADFNSRLPFADEALGAILMIDALEHTDQPLTVLRELHRILRPGGLAILFTPPYDSVRWILAERLHRLITGRRADHISPFTEESLSWSLDRSFTRFRLGRINGNLTMYAIARKAWRADADHLLEPQ